MWKRIKAWWNRHKYPAEMQIEALREIVERDAKWMGHNSIVAALSARYRSALSEGWYKEPVEAVAALRRRLGLIPGAVEADAKKAVAEVRVLSAETAHAVHSALTKALATVENDVEKSKIAAAIREVEEKHPESAA